MTVACIELAPLSLTIVLAWKAGAWTFAVYAHYNRGHFYNAHPKVFVTYKGGHNRIHGMNLGSVIPSIGYHFIEMFLAPGYKSCECRHK